MSYSYFQNIFSFFSNSWGLEPNVGSVGNSGGQFVVKPKVHDLCKSSAILSPNLVTSDIIKAITAESLKIPAISHSIWLTRQGNRKEIAKKDVENLIAKVELLNLDPVEWEHILWTNDMDVYSSETLDRFSSAGIKLRDIAELKEQMGTYDLILKGVEEKEFGFSVDALRYELLKILGGFYSDLNYQLCHSPLYYMKDHDFIVDLSAAKEKYPWKEIFFGYIKDDNEGAILDPKERIESTWAGTKWLIENWMVTSAPNNPILQEILDKMQVQYPKDGYMSLMHAYKSVDKTDTLALADVKEIYSYSHLYNNVKSGIIDCNIKAEHQKDFADYYLDEFRDSTPEASMSFMEPIAECLFLPFGSDVTEYSWEK